MQNFPDKIKILYIITQSNFGGAQISTFDLAVNLNKARFTAAVAAGPDGDYTLNQLLDERAIQNFRLKRLRRPISPINDILALIEIYRLIKREQPDILHLHSSKAGLLGSVAGKIAGVKVIYTVHGAVFEAAFSWLARKFFLLLEKLTAPFKDKIICVSENDRRLWLKHNAAPAKKLTVIRNGVNLNIDFAEKDEAREKLFEEISPLFGKEGPGEIYLIGSIGYFYPEKNYTALIEAAALIKKSPQAGQNNIIFLIIGDGQERPLLKSLIKKHNLENTFFLPGAVSSASKYLKAFDIFVLPSVKEGLPYTILEAMAAGVPIVAANVGGIPEMITSPSSPPFEGGHGGMSPNPSTGFLVAPRDAAALAEKIIILLENPALAEKFAVAAKEKVKEFSLEKMINETEKIYSELTK